MMQTCCQSRSERSFGFHFLAASASQFLLHSSLLPLSGPLIVSPFSKPKIAWIFFIHCSWQLFPHRSNRTPTTSSHIHLISTQTAGTTLLIGTGAAPWRRLLASPITCSPHPVCYSGWVRGCKRRRARWWPLVRAHQHGVADEAVQHGHLARPDVAERDGIDEGGEAAWGGVVTGVVVGQQRRHLAHRLRQLRELLDGLHRRRCTRVPHPLPAPDLDGSGAPAAAAMLPTH